MQHNRKYSISDDVAAFKMQLIHYLVELKLLDSYKNMYNFSYLIKDPTRFSCNCKWLSQSCSELNLTSSKLYTSKLYASKLYISKLYTSKLYIIKTLHIETLHHRNFTSSKLYPIETLHIENMHHSNFISSKICTSIFTSQ